MSPFKRGKVYHIDIRWRGYPRIRVSTDTTNKARAIAMERTLHALRSAGRRDLLGLLADGRVMLPALHGAYERGHEALDQLAAKAESPELGPLVVKWLEWLGSPAGVSPRTKRRYSPHTVGQYRRSWNGFFATLPRGRRSTLSDLTRGFVLDYRSARQRATGGKERKTVPGKPLSGATLNRDIAALGAFLTWAQHVAGFAVDRPQLPRERESRGRERWLSAEELRAFERECPREWWPLFAVLFYTGARLSEAQGLRGADVLLHAKRITIHEAERRVKSQEAVRHLPIPDVLEQALAAHLARTGPGPADLVFPDCQRYPSVRRVWDITCGAAEIHGATPRDARHTFGVHAAQSGIPIVRLQKLLGHSTPMMTMRYMQHAPEAYLDEDAAAIAAHMSGHRDPEVEARVVAARRSMKGA